VGFDLKKSRRADDFSSSTMFRAWESATGLHRHDATASRDCGVT